MYKLLINSLSQSDMMLSSILSLLALGVLFVTSYFLLQFISFSVPGSTALLVTLPGLAAQIQMDYCKPVICGPESVAQW